MAPCCWQSVCQDRNNDMSLQGENFSLFNASKVLNEFMSWLDGWNWVILFHLKYVYNFEKQRWKPKMSLNKWEEHENVDANFMRICWLERRRREKEKYNLASNWTMYIFRWMIWTSVSKHMSRFSPQEFPMKRNGIKLWHRVFIKYCVFFRIFKNIPDSGLSLFSLGVSVCTHTRQVEQQRCSRTGRAQKNHQI